MSEKKYANVGGQAVMEGIMMRSPLKSVMAVRKPSGEIVIERMEFNNIKKSKIAKIPFIRGVFSFVESLLVGYKAISRSAEISTLENEEIVENSDKSKKTEKPISKTESNIIIIGSMILGICLAMGLFVALPTLIVDLFIKGTLGADLGIWEQGLRGVIRIIIILAYIILISLFKDVKRLFKYHGAEHKTIFCFENREELTVENIRKYPRLHPRCGTSFLLIVLVVSMILYTFIYMIPGLRLLNQPGIQNTFLKIALNLLLLPLVAGASFEVLRFTGRYDNKFTKILSAPGKAFQRITTKEPDDDQIEIAIAALNASLINDETGEVDTAAAYMK